MPAKFEFTAGLKGVRVEAGFNDRIVGIQTDQSVLQEKDIDAAKRQIDLAKTKLGNAWEDTKKRVAEAKKKVEDELAARKAAKQVPPNAPVQP